MKQITLCTFFLWCLGSMPLWAPKKEDQTQESPKCVAAAANPSVLQTTTPAAAKSVPRKVVQRPEPFVLEKQSLKTLRSTAPEDAKAKEALLEHAARTFDLKLQNVTLRGDTTELMAPFVNVRSLELRFVTDECRVVADDLPMLPCPQKLESLFVGISIFKTVNNIKYYPNLRTLVLKEFKIQPPERGPSFALPNQDAYFAMIAPLKNLHRFHCEQALLSGLNDKATHERSLMLFLENNPQINDLSLTGWVSPDILERLEALPLRTFSLRACTVYTGLQSLLSCKTLEEVTVRRINDKTDLACLRDAPCRVLSLKGYKLSVKSARVLCAMTELKELSLSFSALNDPVVSELLTLAPQLHTFHLESYQEISPEMRQKLRNAFGDRVSFSKRAIVW
ncbi:MAG: hypothetical protein ACPGUZ_00420 [Holosporaceae bacterium]